MTASIAIMAHPSRAAYVDELRATLGDVPVAWHEGPDATREDRSPIWRTRRAALLLHGDDPFHCVIQDDAILGQDFRARLDALCTGDYLYGLFYRRSPRWAEVHKIAMRSVRRGGFTAPGFVRGVGLALPTVRIPDLVTFGDAVGDRRGDDYRIKHWAIARGLETYLPLPSMVDHRLGPSLARHNGDRQAWRFR